MKFLGTSETPAPDNPMIARVFKVYCYRTMKNGLRERQVWYETEDCRTGAGIAWSPDKKIAVEKANAFGFIVIADKHIVVKLYHVKEN